MKQRYYPTLGFKALETAAVFCRLYDDVRSCFRPRQKMGEEVPAGKRRELFTGRYLRLQDLLTDSFPCARWAIWVRCRQHAYGSLHLRRFEDLLAHLLPPQHQPISGWATAILR